MATTVALFEFCVLGIAFLIRFLIPMHQERARMRRRTAVVKRHCGEWDISIEHPIPGAARAIRWSGYSAVDQRTKKLNATAKAVALVVAVATMCLLVSGVAHAQETVFNVPSGDVLDRGKGYFEFDATYMPSSTVSGLTPRIVFGVGHGIEVGLNVNGITPGVVQTTLIPTIKWKAYDGGSNGWAFLFGDDFYIPVQNRSYDAGNYTYGEFAKTWARTKTRTTLGAYVFTRNVVAPANRGGGQFAIEQSISARVTLAADWYTGNHALGYATPGIIVKATSKLTLYGTYQIGNRGAALGNTQMLVELGWNFD